MCGVVGSQGSHCGRREIQMWDGMKGGNEEQAGMGWLEGNIMEPWAGCIHIHACRYIKF